MELKEIDELIDKHLKNKSHLLGGSIHYYNVTGIVNDMFRNILRKIIFEACEKKTTNELQQINNDSVTIDDVKHLIYYGKSKDEKVIINETKGRLDYSTDMMFDLLEKYSVYDRLKVEQMFWERIKILANTNFD